MSELVKLLNPGKSTDLKGKVLVTALALRDVEGDDLGFQFRVIQDLRHLPPRHQQSPRSVVDHPNRTRRRNLLVRVGPEHGHIAEPGHFARIGQPTLELQRLRERSFDPHHQDQSQTGDHRQTHEEDLPRGCRRDVRQNVGTRITHPDSPDDLCRRPSVVVSLTPIRPPPGEGGYVQVTTYYPHHRVYTRGRPVKSEQMGQPERPLGLNS